MDAPFHFSFFVTNLDETRRFYGDVLGCREGRSTEHWVDFDFFGHQISTHKAETIPSTRNTGQVDGIAVPMPHFGCILPWEEFQSLADRITTAGVKFIIAPRLRFEGQPGEQATMFLTDPSGNALEFKSFKHPEHVFTH
jgi:hypothetical protein